eukprot:NODE_206_length_14836_cov_0.232408.p1 type:complete len:584 gc:universal NODE_206_length_14836_cov_0.232408:6116-4365(-)
MKSSVFNDFNNLLKDINTCYLSIRSSLINEIESLTVITKWPIKIFHFSLHSIQYYYNNNDVLIKEVLSGLCVSTLMVPEVVAFSYAAHLEPEDGLFATVFMAVIASLFTSVGGMANGAAGALAVVTKELMDNLGPLGDLPVKERREYVWLTIIFVGILQMLVGLFKLAKFIKLIPETAMIGFLNGLSILIFITQLTIFKTCDSGTFTECSIQNKLYYMDTNSLELWLTILCVFQTVIIMVLFPMVPRIGKILPNTLVALCFTTMWEHLINRTLIHQAVRTVGDISNITGNFPVPGLPNISNIRWNVALLYAAMLALIGLCESIMTLVTVSEKLQITTTSQMAIQESFAQGLANLVCGLFKTQGGGAMIAQAMANVYNGGKNRLSGISVGFSVLIFITGLPFVIKLAPVACLSGVLWVIVFKTFYWRSFFLLFKIPVQDSMVIVLVTVLAVMYNLATAVFAGVVLAALCNSWGSSKLLKITVNNKQDKVYICQGPLYFGSVHLFNDKFDVFRDPDNVILDMKECNCLDYSAVKAINDMYIKYSKMSKTFDVININSTSIKLILDCGVDFIHSMHEESVENIEMK